jgi:hypothetical protein
MTPDQTVRALTTLVEPGGDRTPHVARLPYAARRTASRSWPKAPRIVIRPARRRRG